MRKLTVTLFSRVELPYGAPAGGMPVGARLVSALNKELATLGYTMERRLADSFAGLPRASFDTERKALLDTLSEVSGTNRRHATLFRMFPYDRDESLDFLDNWLLAWASRVGGRAPDRLRIAPNGMIVDLDRMGRDGFDDGEDWIQFALNRVEIVGDGLQEDDEVRHAFASVTPLKPLLLADDAFLARKAGELLGRNSSLSVDEKAFLHSLADEAGHRAVDALLSSGTKVFRETLPLAYKMARDPSKLSVLTSSATDVLRIAVALSDSEGDLSLKDPVRFKLPTRHRKALLCLLEGQSNLAEDLLRHRERWLRLGERLNPGTADNRARFPRVAEAFALLRNSPAAIPSFRREVEAKTRAREIDADLLEMLAARPGELMRRLDLLLRTGRDGDAVVATLSAAVGSVPTKMLFEVQKYLDHRAAATGRARVFVPKGRENRMQIVPDRRAAIPAPLLEAASAVLAGEIAARCVDLEPMGRVYLDPALREVVLPYNRRGDSSSSVPVMKGSRYPLGNSDVVRLFVHWTGRDVDLSLLCLDEKLNVVGQVSWTNLKEFSCVHSGDVQIAPNGASEFIDFEISNLLENKARYAVASLISYAGGNFSEFPCFAGFMERDSLRSGHKFEPASVSLKFDVNGAGTSSLPLIIDLVERKVIFADILSGTKDYGTVEGMDDKLAAQTRAVLELPQTKPTAWDVLAAHVAARGELVDDPARADVAHMAANIDIEWVGSLTAMPSRGASRELASPAGPRAP